MDIDRRKLLFRTASVSLAIPFIANLSKNVSLLAWAETGETVSDLKSELTLLNDRPVNMEAPAHLLDDKVTPASRFFVRNNGITPHISELTAESWKLQIDGEVETPTSFTIEGLKKNFETVTLQLQMECGGNGRKYYIPGASGNQWTFGAISCAEWTGVRLGDVLKSCKLKDSAVYTAHYSIDKHLSGSEKKPISRGVPIHKALEQHSIIAWAMNGEDIPIINGHPLRLLIPGWPGSCSQKWINKITVRDQIHDGTKMTGKAYRVPKYPVAPGTTIPDEDMKIIESMPVKSLITYPKTGMRVNIKKEIEVRGHAWAGDLDVRAVDISIDFGATWLPAKLDKPVNKYAWQHWSGRVNLPQSGYYEVWARAQDKNGAYQPALTPGWNPKGYLNNMQHRIALIGL